MRSGKAPAGAGVEGGVVRLSARGFGKLKLDGNRIRVGAAQTDKRLAAQALDAGLGDECLRRRVEADHGGVEAQPRAALSGEIEQPVAYLPRPVGFGEELAALVLQHQPDPHLFLEEAALVDGAGRWRIFWSIILPNLRPGLGALAIIVALGHEHAGVPDRWVDEADTCVQIPMVGRGASLNVAVAGSLVLYRLAGLS